MRKTNFERLSETGSKLLQTFVVSKYRSKLAFWETQKYSIVKLKENPSLNKVFI